MNTKEAVAKRILQLCEEKHIAINALANISGVAPSTIYSMLNEKSQNPGVVSIKKICDGLEITVREFFDCDLFDSREQEIY
ncbi:MAG: helix-turn-helix transcriptional regulator [Clostridia bacterium]|jgi:transcriptional regulator with XRE-family HTH domain|nr:helix-turn-helix transcriptional regulator [Clostridia bacterium]